MEDKRFSFDSIPSHQKYLPPYVLDRSISDDQLQLPYCEVKRLLCGICSFLLKNPITLLCGHTFCYGCLNVWFSEKLCNSCPSCRNHGPPLHYYNKNIILYEEIEELPVKCPSKMQNEDSRCEAELKIQDLEAHSKKCLYIQLTCECGVKIPRDSFLESDEQCLCPERTCEYCFSTFQRRLIKFHSDSCQNETVKCTYCGDTYIRKDRIKHEHEECFVPCPYVQYGCKLNRLTPVALKKHLTENRDNHLLLVLRYTQPEVYREMNRISTELETSKVTPQKDMIKKLVIEFNTSRVVTDVILNQSITKSIENIAQKFDYPSALKLSLKRKKTGILLRPNLTLLDYDIQEFEVLVLEKPRLLSVPNKTALVVPESREALNASNGHIN